MPAAGYLFSVLQAAVVCVRSRWPIALVSALLGIAMVLSPLCAFGYVLPGRFITELMLEHVNPPRQLRVQQRLKLHDRTETSDNTESETSDNSETEAVSFQQTVSYRLPGQFRSDIQTEQLQRIHAVNNEEAITVIDGNVVSSGRDWMTRYKDLFLFPDRQRLNRKLAKGGIDVDVSSLGRFEDTVCYVIGAEYPDLQAQQLWVEKEGFRPVRWVVKPPKQSGAPPRAEIRFPKWRRVGKTRYPEKIVFYEKGSRIQAIVVKDIEINPEIAAEVFDIEALQQRYGKTGQPAQNDSSTNDIQQQIEEFKQLYE
ncbi:MAG: hypothetical protein ACQERN_02700 [Thermodesulfobacteriota bacterium]